MESVQDIMTKVKFIASVRRDEKINVKQMTVQPNSMWTVITRLWHQENRAHTLAFLVNTIQRAFEVLQNHIESKKHSEMLFCQNLAADLQACIPALQNLRYTYAHDRIFACSLHTLQEMMVAKMGELAKHPSGLFQTLAQAPPPPPPPFRSEADGCPPPGAHGMDLIVGFDAASVFTAGPLDLPIGSIR